MLRFITYTIIPFLVGVSVTLTFTLHFVSDSKIGGNFEHHVRRFFSDETEAQQQAVNASSPAVLSENEVKQMIANALALNQAKVPETETPILHPPSKHAATLALPQKKYAYVFYATTHGHACGAFVNIAALKETGTNDPNISFVLLTYNLNSKELNAQAQKMNVTIKAVNHLKNFKGGIGYYKDVMVKLRIFELFDYDRVIYMDADMMVRKNLDHLFFLPETSHIAGPRVYFNQNPAICSCLMVVSPTPSMWERIMKYYGPDGYVKEKKLYDMDLVNKEFINEATVLPGIYQLLSSHLEGTGHWADRLQKFPFMPAKLGMPGKTIDEIYSASSIIHFTPHKPYTLKTVDAVKKTKAGVGPRYLALFERWHNLAAKHCPLPGMKFSESHNYESHF